MGKPSRCPAGKMATDLLVAEEKKRQEVEAAEER